MLIMDSNDQTLQNQNPSLPEQFRMKGQPLMFLPYLGYYHVDLMICAYKCPLFTLTTSKLCKCSVE